MGGTLGTGCPHCGGYGVCCQSQWFSPEERLKMKQPEGVWCAFYPKSTNPHVFASELDALRFAQDLDGGMTVKLIEYGSHVE